MDKSLKKITSSPAIKIIAGYLMIGWLLMQVAEIMVPALRLQDWVLSAVVFLLIILFPIVLLTAWGLHSGKTGTGLSPAGPDGKRQQGYADYIIFGVAVLVISWIGFDLLNSNQASDTLAASDLQVSAPPGATNSPLDQPVENNVKSIAVLPFTDLSEGADKAYYANGIAEEILNTLTRMEGLQVAGRTASFAARDFASKPVLIRNALDVDHLLTGSLRYSSQRVRISVQLEDLNSGYVLWAESYDRPAGDIFDVQEEIARATANELQIVLGIGAGKRLVKVSTTNPEAYDLFLQGHEISLARFGDSLPNAIALYEEAVALDPEFARGWAALAEAHVLMPSYNPVKIQDAWAISEEYAEKALLIDPESADAYSVLGYLYTQQRRHLEMHAAFQKALSLQPRNVEIIYNNALSLVQVGKITEAGRQFHRMVEMDANLPYGYTGLAYTHMCSGDLDAAERYARRALFLGFLPANWSLGEIAGLRNNPQKARRLISPAFSLGLVREFSSEEIDVLVEGMFGNADAKQEAVQIIDTYLANNPVPTEGLLPYFMFRLGDFSRGLKVMSEIDSPWNEILFGTIWSPAGEKVRQDPAFIEFTRDAQLLEYWQTHGWPDKCKPGIDGRPTCN